MLLSEFARSDLTEAHGLVVDEPDFMPRAEIVGVGFKLAFDGARLHHDLLDTVISYKTVGIGVILETDALDIDPVSLLTTLQSLDVGLRLSPPHDRESFEGYLRMVRAFAEALPGLPGFGRQIDPVSPALMTAIRRRLGGDDACEMPQAGAVNNLGAEAREMIVEATCAGLADALGGQEALGEYLDLHVAAIHEDGRRKMADYMARQVASA